MLDEATCFGLVSKAEELIPQIVVIVFGLRGFYIMPEEIPQSLVDKGVVRPDAELLLDREAIPAGGNSCGNFASQYCLVQSYHSSGCNWLESKLRQVG